MRLHQTARANVTLKILLPIALFTLALVVYRGWKLDQNVDFFGPRWSLQAGTLDGNELPVDLKCDPIDLVVMCGDYKWMDVSDAMLKSLVLANSYHHMTVHFFTEGPNCQQWLDDFAYNIRHQPQVRIVQHNTTEWREQRPDAKNYVGGYYPNVLIMSKMDLPDLLPTIDKIIVLDLDMLVLSDIHPMWRQFDTFNGAQMIGAAIDFGGWYDNKDHWPGMREKTGMNGGVVMMHLERMRRFNWTSVWRAFAEKEMKERKGQRPHLPDQDIYNLVLRNHSNRFFHMPCTYNVQMGKYDRMRFCPIDETIDTHLAHFNWGNKADMLDREEPTERRMHSLVQRLHAMTYDELNARMTTQQCRRKLLRQYGRAAAAAGGRKTDE